MIAFASTMIFALTGFVQAPVKRPTQPNDNVRCGSYCLTVAASASGSRVFSLDEVEEILGEPGAKGYSLLQLNDAARKLGFETATIRTSTRNLEYRRRSIGERFACIASFGKDHFVLIYGSDGKIVRIADPPRTYNLDIPVFEKEWTGNCLLIGTEPLSTEESVIASLRNRALAKRAGVTGVSVLLAVAIGAAFVRLQNRTRSSSATVLMFLCLAVFWTGGCADRDEAKVASDLASNDPSKSDSNTGGQIEIAPARHSLGKVRGGQGQMIPIVSTIRNTSDEILKIGKVTISCGCTQASIDKPVLKPGETARLTANVKVGESQESRSSHIRIESSDRLRPVSEIEIDWVADLPLKTEPSSVVRHDLSTAEKNEFEIDVISKYVALCDECEVLTYATPDKLKLDWDPNVDIDRPGHSEVSSDNRDKKLGTLKCVIQPEEIDLHHREEVRIELACRGETIAFTALPVNWTFRRSYSVAPSRAFFGTLKSGQSVTKSIVVRSLKDETPMIRSVQLRHQAKLMASRVESVSEDESRIDLTITAPDEKGPWTDEIVIGLDSREQPSIRLPVSCFVD